MCLVGCDTLDTIWVVGLGLLIVLIYTFLSFCFICGS